MYSQTISLIMTEWSFDFPPSYWLQIWMLLSINIPGSLWTSLHFFFVLISQFHLLTGIFFNCLIGNQTNILHFLHQTGNYFFNLLELCVMECNLFHLGFLKNISYFCPSFKIVFLLSKYVLCTQNPRNCLRIQERVLIPRPKIRDSC